MIRKVSQTGQEAPKEEIMKKMRFEQPLIYPFSLEVLLVDQGCWEVLVDVGIQNRSEMFELWIMERANDID